TPIRCAARTPSATPTGRSSARATNSSACSSPSAARSRRQRSMAQKGFQVSAGQLAERFGLVVHGDASRVVDGVGTLSGAGPGQLSFLANSKYRSQLAGSRAGVVVVRAADAEGQDRTLLVAP